MKFIYDTAYPITNCIFPQTLVFLEVISVACLECNDERHVLQLPNSAYGVILLFLLLFLLP